VLCGLALILFFRYLKNLSTLFLIPNFSYLYSNPSPCRYRRCMAVDKTKLRVKKSHVYVWSAVDVDFGIILAIYASWSRNMLIALKFLRMVLDRCVNRPLIVVRYVVFSTTLSALHNIYI
jgi:transposase-like protein